MYTAAYILSMHLAQTVCPKAAGHLASCTSKEQSGAFPALAPSPLHPVPAAGRLAHALVGTRLRTLCRLLAVLRMLSGRMTLQSTA